MICSILLASLYFTKHTDSYLISAPPSSTIKEKYLVGTETYLVSAKLIAYLKWLIYLAAFKDCSNVDHLLYYNKEVAFLNHPNNQICRLVGERFSTLHLMLSSLASHP